MCECKNVMLYLTSYTIGTYGYSSKSVALRFMVKSFCEVGNGAVNDKPYNNIDDGSTTFKVDSKRVIEESMIKSFIVKQFLN